MNSSQPSSRELEPVLLCFKGGRSSSWTTEQIVRRSWKMFL